LDIANLQEIFYAHVSFDNWLNRIVPGHVSGSSTKGKSQTTTDSSLLFTL